MGVTFSLKCEGNSLCVCQLLCTCKPSGAEILISARRRLSPHGAEEFLGGPRHGDLAGHQQNHVRGWAQQRSHQMGH